MGARIEKGRKGRKELKNPIALSKDCLPYERQPKETDQAFSGFCVYRDMGLERSLERAAKQFKKGPNYMQMLAQWSARWQWRARCLAWDREVDRQKRDAEIKEIVDMRRRHVQLALSLQGLAATELQKMLRRAQKAGSGIELTPDQVARLLELGVKQERTSRGEPGEITEQQTRMEVDESALDKRIEHLLKISEREKKKSGD